MKTGTVISGILIRILSLGSMVFSLINLGIRFIKENIKMAPLMG